MVRINWLPLGSTFAAGVVIVTLTIESRSTLRTAVSMMPRYRVSPTPSRLTAETIAWRGNYFPDFITPAAFDRRHQINVSMDYRLAEDEGPQFLGRHILQNFGVNVLGTIKSGRPYTQFQTPVRRPIYDDITDDIKGRINGARMPWTNRIDLRVDRRFTLGGDATLTAFLWIQNLLDSDNVLGVYRGTGLAFDDGFLDTQAGRQMQRTAADPDAFRFHYDSFTSNPVGTASSGFTGARAWGFPRRARIGLRLGGGALIGHRRLGVVGLFAPAAARFRRGCIDDLCCRAEAAGENAFEVEQDDPRGDSRAQQAAQENSEERASPAAALSKDREAVAKDVLPVEVDRRTAL